MVIATFTSSQKKVVFEDGAFVADGKTIKVGDVLEHDRLGTLTWVSPEMRDWAYALSTAAPGSQESRHDTTAASGRSRPPDPVADWVARHRTTVLVLVAVAVALAAFALVSNQRSNRAVVLEYVEVWDLVRVRDVDDGEVHYADPVDGLTLHVGDEVRLADGNDGGFYVNYVGVLEGEDVRRVIEVTRPAEAR